MAKQTQKIGFSKAKPASKHQLDLRNARTFGEVRPSSHVLDLSKKKELEAPFEAREAMFYEVMPGTTGWEMSGVHSRDPFIAPKKSRRIIPVILVMTLLAAVLGWTYLGQDLQESASTAKNPGASAPSANETDSSASGSVETGNGANTAATSVPADQSSVGDSAAGGSGSGGGTGGSTSLDPAAHLRLILPSPLPNPSLDVIVDPRLQSK